MARLAQTVKSGYVQSVALLPRRADWRTHRQYVRYIQWFITLPLLLLELLLATGLTLSDIFTTIFMGWVLVVCGLVGAFVPTTYKWGFYVFGLFALFYIPFNVLTLRPNCNLPLQYHIQALMAIAVTLGLLPLSPLPLRTSVRIPATRPPTIGLGPRGQ